MCNLYHVSEKEDFERFLRQIAEDDWRVPEYGMTTVGPYQPGVFVRGTEHGSRAVIGQWGAIAPGSKTRRPDSRAILTNNARIESIATRPTYRAAWKAGQRCLIPASWYQEPNWETGKNIWWRLKRADGLPWMLAGIWSEWTDPESGEIVPNYSMITLNCDHHQLLNRLHKPDPKLPDDQQDKRAVAHIDPDDWDTWLHGDVDDAMKLVQTQPTEVYDLADAQRTDELLAAMGRR